MFFARLLFSRPLTPNPPPFVCTAWCDTFVSVTRESIKGSSPVCMSVPATRQAGPYVRGVSGLISIVYLRGLRDPSQYIVVTFCFQPFEHADVAYRFHRPMGECECGRGLRPQIMYMYRCCDKYDRGQTSTTPYTGLHICYMARGCSVT